MMGPRQMAQGALFYEFSIEDHVPPDHLLRAMDRFTEAEEAILWLRSLEKDDARLLWLRANGTQWKPVC